jgi:hypothetical protein
MEDEGMTPDAYAQQYGQPMPPPQMMPPQGPYSETDWRSSNDFVQMVRDLTTPAEKATFDVFLARNPLSPEAQDRLMMFYRLVLSPTMVGGNIKSWQDEQALTDKYLIAKVDLPMGLWKYDLNPAFNMIVDLIDLSFQNNVYKARHGFLLKKLAHNTQELHNYDGRQFDGERQSFVSKLTSWGRG